MISRMPEEKLYYVLQLFESLEDLSENTVKEVKTPEQRALEDLKRFRKRGDAEIDYKAESAKAREEKYAVLIDTNVLADVLLGRDSYYDTAYNILAL